MYRCGLFCALLLLPSLRAQTPDSRSLSGRYFIRHLLLTTDAGGAIGEARSFYGTANFDGAGGFTYQGQQVVGNGAAAGFGGSGVYSVRPNGFVTLSNPQRSGVSVNGRLGTGALVGSSTEAAGSVFDLLIAVAAPAGGISNATLSGAYWVSSLEFLSASSGFARNSFFRLSPNGQGSLGEISVAGQAANLGQQYLTQTVTGATYSLTADGSGSAIFPLPAGAGATARLLSGSKVLYVSADGSLVLGGAAAGHELMVGVKAMSGGATNASWKDLFWTAGLRLEAGRFQSFAGATNSGGQGKALLSRRVRSAEGVLDFTGANGYVLQPGGSGIAESSQMAVGEGGRLFIGSGVSLTDSRKYEIQLGIRPAAISGSGAYLHPQGVVNAASFAPVGNPVSPGGFVTLYGSNLASQTAVAGSLPFPTTLGGVQVLVNGRPASVYAVSPTQISALIPFETTGDTAAIQVNGSNTVDVPLAKTAPGVFTVPPGGTGPGAILHPDFSLVNAGKPARRGGTVLIFLTGLGAVSPRVADGAAAPVNPLSTASTSVKVYIGGKPGQISFQGLAPQLAGLYQLNVRIPDDAPLGAAVPLAIETPEAFHDQVDIAVSR